MKIFLSWSGETSKAIAEALKTWIPNFLQYAQPYFTPSDIEKGAKWESEINKNLNECNIGIICLTKDNISKPWILFEAGALSNKLDRARVCTLLFNFSSSELTWPLAMFQHTEFNKSDFKQLLININESKGSEKISEGVLNNSFEKFFPELESSIKIILNDTKDKQTIPPPRTDRALLEELLELSRNTYKNLNEKFTESPKFYRSKTIDDITDTEIKTIYSKIIDYMKQNNFRLKEYQLIDEDDVFYNLTKDPEVKKIVVNTKNLREIIKKFTEQ